MLLPDYKFESDYAKVEYLPMYNVVYHTWRSEVHGEEYRKAFEYSRKLLMSNKGSAFILDLTNGFIDSPEDLEWAFDIVLPDINTAGCSKMIFIVRPFDDGENNNMLWIRKAEMYFRTFVADSFDVGIGALSQL